MLRRCENGMKCGLDTKALCVGAVFSTSQVRAAEYGAQHDFGLDHLIFMSVKLSSEVTCSRREKG